jgi:hypothetical protein
MLLIVHRLPMSFVMVQDAAALVNPGVGGKSTGQGMIFRRTGNTGNGAEI